MTWTVEAERRRGAAAGRGRGGGVPDRASRRSPTPHRHSGAQTCTVRLRRDDGRLRVTVSDDGQGLAAARTPGVGLSSMTGAGGGARRHLHRELHARHRHRRRRRAPVGGARTRGDDGARCGSWWSTTTTSSARGSRRCSAATDTVEVVGRAGDGRRAVELALDLQPDVILMDLQMPQLNGVEATARIVQSSPHISVLVLTMMEDDDSVFAAVRAGARGYLLKGARRSEIVRAIEAVGAGEVIFGPGIAERVMTYFRARAQPADGRGLPRAHRSRAGDPRARSPRASRTPRSPATLGLSVKTVRNHASNIFAKLQVAHRAQAIVLAREAGIENPGPPGPERRPSRVSQSTRSRTSRRRRPRGRAAARAPRRGR